MNDLMFPYFYLNPEYIYLVINGKRFKTCNPDWEEHVEYVFGESAKYHLSKDRHSDCYEF